MKFSPLTVGQRIRAGYVLLLLLGAVFGAIAVVRMLGLASGADFLARAVVPQVKLSTDLQEHGSRLDRAVRTYGLTGAADELQTARTQLEELRHDFATADRLVGEYPELVVLARSNKAAQSALDHYEQDVNATQACIEALTTERHALDTAAAQFLQSAVAYRDAQRSQLDEDVIAGANNETQRAGISRLNTAADMLLDGNLVRVANFKGQALRDAALLRGTADSFARTLRNCDDLISQVRDETEKRELVELRGAVESYQEGIAQVTALMDRLSALQVARTASADAFSVAVDEITAASFRRTDEYARASVIGLKAAATSTWLGGLFAVVVAAVIGWWTVRTINRALVDITDTLNHGARQVSTAATQVSGSSQSLAEGASEQAASLEEISASVEELVSMTKRNSEHAQSSKGAANAARSSAESGVEEMGRLESAMHSIQQSSEAIGRIIKTIDEIAFQTNILALNAAVEAARAGEAGAGFAVVADEVRALAHRSAEAARDTAEKIADATQRSHQGVELSTKVTTALQDIVGRVREVDSLVVDVATASSEQTTGLGQVSLALTQMDGVTQSSAANAEETASAAEELNAQSAEMQAAAARLARLVGLRAVQVQERGQHNDRTRALRPAATTGRSSPSAKGPRGFPSPAAPVRAHLARH